MSTPLPADRLVPNDPRVQHCTANLNGKTYKYMVAEAEGERKGTIFLIHGWPDLGFGWRHQVLLLRSLGLRVVVPDMMGYGGTDAPEPLEYYSYKRAANDVATLAHILGAPQIHLGGHDWGGAIVYRIALWHPNLILSVFSICTPYVPPAKEYISLETLVAGPLPNFRYQLHLSGPEVEAKLVGPEKIRPWLAGMYGAHGPNGEVVFDTGKGVIFENFEKVDVNGSLLNKQELDFYTEQYSRNGLHGPTNWYRTRKLNWEDEQDWAEKGVRIDCPVMFVQATRDAALPPAMSQGMERHFGEGKLVRREVASHHWCLWAAKDECNGYIKEFVEAQLVRKSNL